MEDEKTLIKKIKYSLKNKRSDTEIIQSLQSKGCNLAYSNALLNKARRPKRLLIFSMVTILILGALSVAALAMVAPSPAFNPNESTQIKNPLEGLRVLFDKKETTQSTNPSNETTQDPPSQKNENEIYLEDIEITPDFISYLLVSIGVTEDLHKNTITREVPMLNFQIDDVTYQTTIDETIQVSSGINPEADIQFNTDKQTMVKATLSGDPGTVFKDSVVSGTTTIETIAGEAELFAKGYLDLYDRFK